MPNPSFTLPSLLLLLSSLLVSECWAKSSAYDWTVNDLLTLEQRPFAIGYRGYGTNLGENTATPLENTTAAVRKAYRKGVSMVDVDVVVTADGQAVLLRSDFLQDYSCVNALTYDQLKQREHQVPTLKQVLRVVKEYSKESPSLSGLINLDLTPPSPLCDPHDISEQLLVHSVIETVAHTQTDQQVVIESSSPSMLSLAANLAPSIARSLSVHPLQLMPTEYVSSVTGYTPTPIAKQTGFGLTWAEIGPQYRMPLYASVEQAGFTAYLTSATFISLSDNTLAFADATRSGGARLWLDELGKAGIQVIMHRADTRQEWNNARALGVDGIQTNNIPMAINKQKGRQSW